MSTAIILKLGRGLSNHLIYGTFPKVCSVKLRLLETLSGGGI